MNKTPATGVIWKKSNEANKQTQASSKRKMKWEGMYGLHKHYQNNDETRVIKKLH